MRILIESYDSKTNYKVYANRGTIKPSLAKDFYAKLLVAATLHIKIGTS